MGVGGGMGGGDWVGEGEWGRGHRKVCTLHGLGGSGRPGLGRCEEGESQKGMHPT